MRRSSSVSLRKWAGSAAAVRTSSTNASTRSGIRSRTRRGCTGVTRMSCIADVSNSGTGVARLIDMTTITTAPHDVNFWRERIRAEYLEMPGLHLTWRQAQRLWGLDESTCTVVLAALEEEKFLRRTRGDSYTRA